MVLKGLWVQELESEEGSPQQKSKLTPKDSQGCPQTSGMWKRLEEKGFCKILSWKRISFHTGRINKEATEHVPAQLTNQSALCMDSGMFPLQQQQQVCQGLRSWEDPTVTWLGQASVLLEKFQGQALAGETAVCQL